MTTLAMRHAALTLCVAGLLAGCTTPQPVLDLASKGAGATDQAEAELKRSLAGAQDSLSARLVLVRQASERRLEQNTELGFASFLQARTGQNSGDAVLERMRTVGEERRRLSEVEIAERAKIDEQHKKALGDAVRVNPESFAASKKAFSDLATELSVSERLALAGTYAKEIQKTLKEIEEQEKKAKEKEAGAAKTDADANKPADAN